MPKTKQKHRGLELLMNMPISDAAAIAHWFGKELIFSLTKKGKRVRKQQKTEKEDQKGE